MSWLMDMGGMGPMDMGGSNKSMDMMHMSFYISERATILFAFWKTGSVAGLLVSCLITFLMCLLYEGLRALRYFVARSELAHLAGTPLSVGAPGGPLPAPRAHMNRDSASVDSTTVFAIPLIRLGSIGSAFTRYRLSQALLYGMQVLLAYLLMLIVMTFNVWLLMAVVIGEMTGYFLFVGTPDIAAATADCCG